MDNRMPEPISGFADALSQMEVVGRSARGLLTVRRTSDRKVRVGFVKGALSRLDSDWKLAEEIRSGLLAALADYDRQYAAIHRRFFGSGLGDAGEGR